MAKYLFGGYGRCLQPVQKFQSDPERVLAVILDRESEKWFRPASGQFQISYRLGPEYHEYQPDFVAELADRDCDAGAEARNLMDDAGGAGKRDAAVSVVSSSEEYAAANGGKPWRYVLIPHDAIAENWRLQGLVEE